MIMDSMNKEYELNVEYPITEAAGINKWWQAHMHYDVNEYTNNQNERVCKIVEKTPENFEQFVHYRREVLLRAFDKYKSNVQYGVEIESEEQHAVIVQWYRDMLDLKLEAFSNIPSRVKYYL